MTGFANSFRRANAREVLAQVREEAAGALWSLSIDDGAKRDIVRAGAPDALARALRSARPRPFVAANLFLKPGDAEAADEPPPPVADHAAGVVQNLAMVRRPRAGIGRPDAATIVEVGVAAIAAGAPRGSSEGRGHGDAANGGESRPRRGGAAARVFRGAGANEAENRPRGYCEAVDEAENRRARARGRRRPGARPRRRRVRPRELGETKTVVASARGRRRRSDAADAAAGDVVVSQTP